MAITKVNNAMQDALAAAQPTITSVGTLTGLDVNGTATMDGLSVDGVATVVGTTTSGILLKSSSGASNGFKLYNDSGTDTAHLNNHFSGSMVFSTNNTERMRIDGATGSLLVGGTSAGAASCVTLSPTGYIQARYSGPSGYFDNTSGSGSTVIFRSNGTNVGSIGVNGGLIAFGQSNTGLGAFNTDRILFPATASGVVQNAQIDLGYANGRFKDLYLSGGVFLGGTGAANKLDDVETGTWTPVPKGSTTAGTISIPAGHQTGTYTKIGGIVHISMFLYGTNFTGAGTFEIHGLPFPHAGSSGTLPVQANSPPWDTLPADNQNITAYLGNSTIMYFRATNRNKGGGYVQAQVTSPSTIGYIRVNGSYQTNS